MDSRISLAEPAPEASQPSLVVIAQRQPEIARVFRSRFQLSPSAYRYQFRAGGTGPEG